MAKLYKKTTTGTDMPASPDYGDLAILKNGTLHIADENEVWQALISKNELLDIGWKGTSNDANDIADGCTVCNSNIPTGSATHYYIFQTTHGQSKCQIAVPVSNGTAIYIRYKYGGAWGAWSGMLPLSGGTLSGNLQVANGGINMNNNDIANVKTIAMQYGAITSTTNNDQALLQNGSVHIVDRTWSGYRPILASAFTQSSSIDGKENITDCTDALDKVLGMNVKEYTRKDDGKKQIGVVVEDEGTPEDIVVQGERKSVVDEETGETKGALNTAGVDLYSMISLCAKAIQELKAEKDAEIAELRKEIEILKGGKA